MHAFRFATTGVRLWVVSAVVATAVVAWVQHVQAQSPAQIGSNSPLPVYVTNPRDAVMLPEGFVPGSRWRFTTWTTPSVLTWTATVNRTSGAWANLTTVAENQSRTTRWYYVPAMPGSWEPE